MTQNSTTIEYRTSIGGFYNLENNLYQKKQMLESAIPNNLQVYGDIEVYKQALETEKMQMELKIDPLVVRWFTLQEQINFLTKYIKGEIHEEKNPKNVQIKTEETESKGSGNNQTRESDEGGHFPD